MLLRLKVKPNARQNRVSDSGDGTLRVEVTATPEKGLANAAVVELLAKTLGLAKFRIVIVRGQSAREKVVEIEGLDEAAVRERLRPPA